VVLDDLDIFIIKKAKSSVESERILAEDKKLKIFQPDIYRNVDRATSDIYAGIPLINKPHVKYPITHTDHKQKAMPLTPDSPVYESPIHLDQANVRVQTSFSQYAVVTNKLSSKVMENEVIPSSSSDSESMSLSPVNSLTNLDVEQPYEPHFHTDKFTKQANKMLRRQEASVLKAREDLSYVNVNQVTAGIDVTEHVSFHRAEWDIERNGGDLSSDVAVAYPPETRLHLDRARTNYEHHYQDLNSADVCHPPTKRYHKSEMVNPCFVLLINRYLNFNHGN
jgi:hypothetical protein